MKLLSVNVSLPKRVEYRGQSVLTGIFKEPLDRRVRVGTTNLEGDAQADLTVHGGPDKAVYVYPFEHYAFWQQELDRYDFSYGQFGENFTVEGLSEEEVQIGDQFEIGTALFQVSQPRVPCYKLGIKMQSGKFIKQFLRSLRTGFYLRVLKRGEVGADDEIERTGRGVNSMTVREICNLLYFDRDNVEAMRKAAAIESLADVWRAPFEGRLAELRMKGATEAGEEARNTAELARLKV